MSSTTPVKTMHLMTVYPPAIVCLMILCLSAAASDDVEAWLDQDDDPRNLLVNEGVLEFLQGPQDHRILQTRNWLTITPDSLRTGWVELHQCQANLDPVTLVEIVYRYQGMRNLRVVSTQGVGHVGVERNTVQMEQVQEGGEVCIEAEVDILKPGSGGAWSLQSGPFHRRFLDGYYPVQLEYRVRWPANRLQLESVYPETQAGFPIREQPGELVIDTLFAGRLTIEVRFSMP